MTVLNHEQEYTVSAANEIEAELAKPCNCGVHA